ncbi:MAG: hypothetical protein IKW03_04100 [Clostridia bacterium]|nr:hypothetical protein [Clostridia bacterium]
MKSLCKDINKMYKSLSTVTKYAFRYGTVLIVTLIICNVYFYLRSLYEGTGLYYTMMFNDITVCIKECMGSVYILPMLYELLSIIRRIN